MTGKPGPRALPPEPWTVPGVSCPGPPGPWAVARAWWRVGRGPWCAIRGPVAVPGAPWCLVRGPRSVRPGARPGGRAARLVRLVACALVRDPRRVRPGGPRPWRVRLVARPPGPGSPAAGGRTPAPGPGPKKRAGSRAARAFARFHTVGGAQNSFLVSGKQAPFSKNSIWPCNFSWNKYNSFHENNLLEMRSAQRPPAPALLPLVPCCVRQGPSPTARGPAA